MARNYNIYFEDRVFECDLFVYSIPYKGEADEVQVRDFDIYWDDPVQEHTLFIHKTSDSDGLLKTEVRDLDIYLNELLTDLEMFVYALPYHENITYAGDIGLDAEIVGDLFQKFELGGGIAPVHLAASVLGEFKKSMVETRAESGLNAELTGVYTKMAEELNVLIDLSPAVQDLCYKFVVGGDTTACVDASVQQADLLNSLGKWQNAVAADTRVDRDQAVKRFAVDVKTAIKQEADGSLTQSLIPEHNIVAHATAEVDIDIIRPGKLYEFDNLSLEDMDEAALDGLDYKYID